MMVTLFENSYYSYGISLSQRWDRKVVITLNARNDHDRSVQAASVAGLQINQKLSLSGPSLWRICVRA